MIRDKRGNAVWQISPEELERDRISGAIQPVKLSMAPGRRWLPQTPEVKEEAVMPLDRGTELGSVVHYVHRFSQETP